MRVIRTFLCCLAMVALRVGAAEDFIDTVEEKLSFSALDDQVRLKLSGLLDLEGYHLPNPAPGLINTAQTNLFNPRLTLFADVQLGPKVYGFVQSRVDRGFDPSNSDARMRLDEYAIRVTPWDDGRFNVEVGKFATIVGVWNERHLSWQNPFINAPLPYENVTFASDIEAPTSAAAFVGEKVDAATKYEYVPIVWGPSYATGAAVSGRVGKFEYAAEMKNAALGSRPETWDLDSTAFQRPSFHARIGFRPNPMWRFGVSAGTGSYLRNEAAASLPRGRSLGGYDEKIVAQDLTFEWHHWQVWAECFEARYEVPRVGNADTIAYFVEAKYKIAPELFAALRWNQQFYGDVSNGVGGQAPWGHDISRLDAALGYRFTPHTQLKLQYSVDQESSGGNGTSHTFAGQFTVRF